MRVGAQAAEEALNGASADHQQVGVVAGGGRCDRCGDAGCLQDFQRLGDAGLRRDGGIALPRIPDEVAMGAFGGGGGEAGIDFRHRVHHEQFGAELFFDFVSPTQGGDCMFLHIDGADDAAAVGGHGGGIGVGGGPDRALRIMKDAEGDRAHEQRAISGLAARGHHDQVGFVFSGMENDHGGGLALQQRQAWARAGECFGRERLKMLVDARPCGGAFGFASVGELGRKFEGVEQREFGFELASPRGYGRRGEPARRGKIDGEEDAFWSGHAVPVILLRWALTALFFGCAAQAQIRFRDAGLGFVSQNGASARKQLIESVAGGVAAFDFDGDGLADVFFTSLAGAPGLFRNRGGMRFEDVTAKAGLSEAGKSIGAAVADFDGDGHADLFVAGYKRNRLYRNQGDGTFRDVTAASGIRSDAFSVAGAWFDYDGDGLVDLLVVNYLDWSPADDRFCGDRAANLRVYCHPRYYGAVPNTLYRNKGKGVFEDVSAASGIAKHAGKGMSAAVADADGDGRPDVFVTNDAMADFLFQNRGDGTFREVALTAGVALNQEGHATSSMGTDFRDYDNDGLPDIALTALTGETFPLFRNLGKMLFGDATQALQTRKRAGWGVSFADFDNDGWKDLFAAGGHVNDLIERFESTTYKQANGLFRNLGGGKFRDESSEAGFTALRAHRGSAVADFDNDGRLDIVVVCLGERAELWRNETEGAGNWVAFDVPLGAEVRVGQQVNLMTSAVSYASSSFVPVHFGVAKVEKLDRVEIRMPGGKVQVLEGIAVNRVHRVR